MSSPNHAAGSELDSSDGRRIVEACRSIRARTAAGLAAALLVSFAAATLAQSADAQVIGASCYDAFYFDGLTSRYSAGHCSGAASVEGYAGAAFDNASAQVATQRNAQDGVFFFAGHVGVMTTSGMSGSILMYESPDANSNLNGLAATPEDTALSQFADATVCTVAGGCRKQIAFTTYPYQADKVNLVVAEGCNTAQDGTYHGVGVTGFAHGAFEQLAGTAIGWHDVIGFPVNADETGQAGDGWANRFWLDLEAGSDYTTAMVDAANSVGNAAGLGSYVEYHHSGAPTTLGPARFYVP